MISQRLKPYTFAIRFSHNPSQNCKRVCLAKAQFRTNIKPRKPSRKRKACVQHCRTTHEQKK